METLSGLTHAVGNRFDKIDRQFKEVREDIAELRGDTERQFKDVRGQLDQMQDKLDHIEHLILEEHARRLEALEQKVGIAH